MYRLLTFLAPIQYPELVPRMQGHSFNGTPCEIINALLLGLSKARSLLSLISVHGGPSEARLMRAGRRFGWSSAQPDDRHVVPEQHKCAFYGTRAAILSPDPDRVLNAFLWQ